MPNAPLIGRKNLWKAAVAVAALLTTMGVFAYAATVHSTKNHDWGKVKDGLADPPNCGARCSEMIHGTGGTTPSTATRAGTTSGPRVATT